MEWGLEKLGGTADVLVEYPRFAFVKRRADGSVDFVSPIPCPYNYGCIPDILSGDGQPLDVVVLGPSLPVGHRGTFPVVAVVGFIDAGEPDAKVICSLHKPSRAELLGVTAFFEAYAVGKRALALTRGIRRETRTVGFIR